MSLQSISSGALFIFVLSTACTAQRKDTAQKKSGVDLNQVAISHDTNRYTQLRAFWDPCTHLRWILMQDQQHPAAPRILVRAHSTTLIEPAPAPAIRSGDLVIITQHTPFANGQLEGTALQDAAVAELLRVRLKNNAHILSVIVDGPGRATMQAYRDEARR